MEIRWKKAEKREAEKEWSHVWTGRKSHTIVDRGEDKLSQKVSGSMKYQSVQIHSHREEDDVLEGRSQGLACSNACGDWVTQLVPEEPVWRPVSISKVMSPNF